jgi:diguanylate cyclase (GGDEF)-like protein/PAS domain S-box-containing protein
VNTAAAEMPEPQRDLRVRLFEAAVTAPTLAWIAYTIAHGGGGLSASVLLWAAMVAIVDLLPIPAWGGLAVSVSFPILLAASLLYAPAIAGLIALVGTSDIREFRGELPIMKTLFIRAQMAASAIGAAAAFGAIGGLGSPLPRLIIGAMVATVVCYSINTIVVAAYTALDFRLSVRSVLVEMHGAHPIEFLIAYLGLGLYGTLIARFYLHDGLWAVATFFAPLALARQMFFRSRALEVTTDELRDRERTLQELSDALRHKNEELEHQTDVLHSHLEKERETVSRLRELDRMKDEFAALIRNSSDVFAIIEADATVRWVSPSIERTLGVREDEICGRHLGDLVHRDDRRAARELTESRAGSETPTELRLQHADGRWVFFETVPTNLLTDGSVRGIVLNLRDISDRKMFEEELAHQAFHDPLTGLANRALFRDRVEHAIDRSRRAPGAVAVLFIDLDDFKAINDTLGHATGDDLLRQVGSRIQSNLRDADTAARLGGDEFAILLEHDGAEPVNPAMVAQRMLTMLETPFDIGGDQIFCQASIGIASGDIGDSGDPDDMLRNADVAMYVAKEKGKGRYETFVAGMHETAIRQLELRSELQQGLEHGQFVLQYQPIMRLDSGEIDGFEALVRWNHPARGLIPPLEFIPLAEENGLIVQLGTWVLGEAAAFARSVRDATGSDLHVAVNLSARQLSRAEIVDEVARALETSGLPASSLVLEITETVMMQDMDLSIVRLQGLKALGVRLAIDDFGTGYSSLNYVRRFPVDILKVDKSFVDGVATPGQEAALTSAVIELAHILDLVPVAEGIEHPDQLERLRALGCELGQGYLFAKPLDPEELRRRVWIETSSNRGRRDAGVGVP